MTGRALRAIVRTEGTCSGAVRFDGTRLPLWVIASRWKSGATDKEVMYEYDLDQGALDAARAYMAAHPEEVRRDLRAQAECWAGEEPAYAERVRAQLRALVDAWPTWCLCGDQLDDEHRPGMRCFGCVAGDEPHGSLDDERERLAAAYLSARALLAEGP